MDLWVTGGFSLYSESCLTSIRGFSSWPFEESISIMLLRVWPGFELSLEMWSLELLMCSRELLPMKSITGASTIIEVEERSEVAFEIRQLLWRAGDSSKIRVPR